jgi:hypothetical protein
VILSTLSKYEQQNKSVQNQKYAFGRVFFCVFGFTSEKPMADAKYSLQWSQHTNEHQRNFLNPQNILKILRKQILLGLFFYGRQKVGGGEEFVLFGKNI